MNNPGPMAFKMNNMLLSIAYAYTCHPVPFYDLVLCFYLPYFELWPTITIKSWCLMNNINPSIRMGAMDQHVRPMVETMHADIILVISYQICSNNHPILKSPITISPHHYQHWPTNVVVGNPMLITLSIHVICCLQPLTWLPILLTPALEPGQIGPSFKCLTKWLASNNWFVPCQTFVITRWSSRTHITRLTCWHSNAHSFTTTSISYHWTLGIWSSMLPSCLWGRRQQTWHADPQKRMSIPYGGDLIGHDIDGMRLMVDDLGVYWLQILLRTFEDGNQQAILSLWWSNRQWQMFMLVDFLRWKSCYHIINLALVLANRT